MKILVVNQILYTHTDGIIPQVESIKDTMIYQMCIGFRNLGHEVVLAAAKEYMPTTEEEYDFEILWFNSNYMNLLPATLLPYSKELRRYLKKNYQYYDLVISKEVFSISSLWASTICPDKTILWVEQANHQHKFKQLPSRFWYNMIAKWYHARVKAIVPCSKRARIFLKTYLGNTTNEIIEHGIDIHKFVPTETKRRQLIVSSQLIKRKNIDSIIRIFSRFHKQQEFQDVKLLIAGRGPEEAFLKRIVHDEDLDSHVKFLGFLSQKALNQHISESLVFLVNTKADLNMVSVPEAVCSGTPILMNRIPLNSWYIKKYELGIVKDLWDESDIVDIIKRNNYFAENCKMYREKLSLVNTAQELINIFKK